MRAIKFLLLHAALILPIWAFQYPVGVPAAWMDPDGARPARPATWTSEIPGYYYVNNVSGTDTSRTYGTPTAPRKTIPSTLPAGSYVEVTGTYSTNTGGSTIITAAGNTNAWVANTDGPAWLVGLDASNRITFANNVIVQGTGLCMEYITSAKVLTFNSGNPASLRTATYMLLRNSEFDGAHAILSNTNAVTIEGSTFSTSSNIIVYNNVIHGYGPLTPDIDRDNIGVFNHGYVDHSWVLDNHIYEMAGGGVGNGADTNTDSGGNAHITNVFVGRNHIHDCWAVGVGFKTSAHLVITENKIHDITDTTWSESKGIGGQYAALDSWLLYNEVYNCNNGIRLESTTTSNIEAVYVIGNLIHDMFTSRTTGTALNTSSSGEAGLAIWGADKRFIIGNTVRNAPKGLAMPNATSSGTADPLAADIENNIFTDCAAEEVFVEQNTSVVILKNNVFFRSIGAPVIRIGGSSSFTVAGLPSKYTGNLLKDPLFVNVATGNYRAQAEIPLIASATLTEDVFADFNTTFGISIPVRTYADFVDIAPVAPSGPTAH